MSNENMVGRKIRITKANRSTFWYADKIGETFTTIRRTNNGYIVTVGGKDDGWHVSDGNYELVDETPVGITIVADSNGINRGYRQVNRPVVVGDRVLVVNAYESFDNYKNGDVLNVVRVNPRTGGIGVPEINRVKPYLCANEFVVLEPSNIVIIDGERFRTVSRKARIGELVKITTTTYKRTDYFTIGDIGKVIYVGRQDITVDFNDQGNTRVRGDGKWYVGPNESVGSTSYVVLEPVAPTSTPQPATSATPSVPSTDELTTLISKLAAQNVSLEKRVSSLEALAAPSPKIVTSASTITSFNERNPLPTLSRQGVIDRAKTDVVELTRIGGDREARLPSGRFETTFYTVEFAIDCEKRIVTATVMSNPWRLFREDGFATCAPDDVFNVNIGRAIALRRALGLPVPDVYTKSPQPTEPQIGDIVTGGETGGSYYSPDKTFTLTAIHGDDSFHYSLTTTGWSKTDWICRSQIGRIVDDSRETAVSL